MRVIGGTHRSRILEEVEGSQTRETKDRVKESIFNSISSYIYDSVVLDLFSGSGSLGIEALSRGAKHAVFNDSYKKAFNVLQNNISTLNLNDQTTVYRNDYIDCIEKQTTPFDVILLDPPYELSVLNKIITLIDENKLLTPSGIIVILSKKGRVITDTEQLVITKTKNMGITKVTYMKWRG